MGYTIVPLVKEEPLTFGADHLPLDGTEGEAWKKAISSLQPRLLPQLKEAALIEEEESGFCVAGGVFAFVPGQELVIDGVDLTLSHCAVHFMDFLLHPQECLQIADEQQAAFAVVNDTDERRARFAKVRSWWEHGYRVLLLQHEA